MIFPDVSLEIWMQQNPILEIKKRKCRSCGSVQITHIPFIEKDWIGIQSLDCKCGKSKAISVATIRKTSPVYESSLNLFDRGLK